MAGINIKVDDAPVRTALDRLGDGRLVEASLKVIGQAMLNSTRARFAAQVDPSGKPWAALNPGYAAGKNGNLILQEAGMAGGLLGSITAQIGGGTLRIGTNKIYGAIHQFGGIIVPRQYPALVFKINGRLHWARQVTIPARPFLGLSDADRAEIPLLIEDVIRAFAR
jgi:phage virion morphogenesis protein